MAARELRARLARLTASQGAQYLPVVLVVPDEAGPARDAVQAQVQHLRQQGRHVIELSESNKHLALAELAEVFAP